MTVIADSAYLKNDLLKLAGQTYDKRDTDFSGAVLYSTPKGAYVSMWFYSNGKITSATSSIYKNYGTTGTNSINNKTLTSTSLKTNLIETCETWYQTVSFNGTTYPSTVLSESCTFSGSLSDGSGGSTGGNGGTGSGSGGTTTTPNPCITQGSSNSSASTSHLVVNVAQPEPTPIGGGTTFPPPTSSPNPCPTVPAGATVKITTSATYKINTDQLAAKFPCAVTLIVNNLVGCGAYSSLIEPFTTNRKPDLTWTSGDLAWGNPSVVGTQSYMLGNTSSDGRSATITLNNAMLQSSSQLLIAAAAVHETLHAYINFNIQTAIGGFPIPAGYNAGISWLGSVDTWATMYGLPSNYSNHYQMMTAYFNLAVTALANLDNNQHTPAQYEMTMLYGLNNAMGANATQTATLLAEYNSLLAQFHFTQADLNAYYLTNLAAATSSRLPGNCVAP